MASGVASTTIPLTPSWTICAGSPESSHVITGFRLRKASIVTSP